MSQATLNLIVLSPSLDLAKRVQLMTNRIQEAMPNLEFKIYPASESQKAQEYIESHKMHSVLVDETYLDTGPDKWMGEFMAKMEATLNKGSPVYFVTTKPDVERTKNLVKAGFTDVLISPLDYSLTVQKLAIHNTETKILAESQLFTLEVNNPIDLGFRYEMKSISEFGMTIKTDQDLEVGLVLTIYTQFLDKDLAAQIKEVKKVDGKPGEFEVFLLFLGVDPAESQSLRKWMKAAYALKNQKSA